MTNDSHGLMFSVESVSLRECNLEDAAFIHELRNDPSLSAHLNAPKSTLKDQLTWLEGYKKRRSQNSEFYFVIEHLGIPAGVVRLYSITDNTFTWGSWIIQRGQPTTVALQSTIAIYQLGFNRLNLDSALFEARIENRNVLRFHLAYGARKLGSDAQNVYFRLDRSEFESALQKLDRLVESSRR